jgi:hypothetical protein
MIDKISPCPSLPSGPEALWAGGQRGGKKGRTLLNRRREKAEMTHSITLRAKINCIARTSALITQSLSKGYHASSETILERQRSLRNRRPSGPAASNGALAE